MTEIHTCSYECDRPECIRAQRDELAARMTAETSNARGEWVLVPRNPTEAMIDAWRDAPNRWVEAYAAMLAAAPPPAAAQQGQAVAEDMGGFTSDTAALAFLHLIGNGNPNVERAVERLRQSLIAQSTQQGGGEVAAWETEDGRVISARQKATALRDGGASASSVAPYTTPLYRTAPPSAPVGVEGFEEWYASVDARFWNNWDACNAAFHAGKRAALAAQHQGPKS